MTCGLFSIFWPRTVLIMRILQGSINKCAREKATGCAARLLWAFCKYTVRIYPECPRLAHNLIQRSIITSSFTRRVGTEHKRLWAYIATLCGISDAWIHRVTRVMLRH